MSVSTLAKTEALSWRVHPRSVHARRRSGAGAIVLAVSIIAACDGGTPVPSRTAALGTRVIDDGLVLSVTDTQCSESTLESGGKTTIHLDCYVRLDVENTSSESRVLARENQFARMGEDRQPATIILGSLGVDLSALAGMLQGNPVDPRIGPRSRMVLWVLFTLPRGAAVDAFELHAAKDSTGFFVEPAG